MVRSSLGRSVLLDSGGLAEEYPFCAISVPDFLELTEWQPHQDLKASGKVRGRECPNCVDYQRFANHFWTFEEDEINSST